MWEDRVAEAFGAAEAKVVFMGQRTNVSDVMDSRSHDPRARATNAPPVSLLRHSHALDAEA
jgi:hypothetical protein